MLSVNQEFMDTAYRHRLFVCRSLFRRYVARNVDEALAALDRSLETEDGKRMLEEHMQIQNLVCVLIWLPIQQLQGFYVCHLKSKEF